VIKVAGHAGPLTGKWGARAGFVENSGGSPSSRGLGAGGGRGEPGVFPLWAGGGDRTKLGPGFAGASWVADYPDSVDLAGKHRAGKKTIGPLKPGEFGPADSSRPGWSISTPLGGGAGPLWWVGPTGVKNMGRGGPTSDSPPMFQYG